MKYTGVVLAGSRPGRDPFAVQFGTDIKALVAIRGEPMVRRPVRALLASQSVGRVIVLTQATDRLAAVLSSDPRLLLRESSGTIAQTLLGLIDDPAIAWPVLVTTADHALLDPAMIDQFIGAAGTADIAVGVVEQRVLMQRFQDAQRTWLKFRGGAYTGANLFALRSPKVAPAIRLWRSVEQDRKKGWRVIAMAGPLTLAGAVLRLLTIDGVIGRLGRKLGLNAKVVRLTNPLAGIDVDKPADHTLVEAILAGKA